MKKIMRALLVLMVAGTIGIVSVNAENCIVEIYGSDGQKKECKECTGNLSNCFDQVNDGETVKILDDVTSLNTDGISIQVEKSFTLDLDNHTITATGDSSTLRIMKESTKVTIKNGTIKYGGTNVNATALKVLKGEVTLENVKVENTTENSLAGAVQVGATGEDTGKLIIEEGTTIDGQYGIVFVNGSTVNINGGTITAKAFAISGNGSDTKENTVNITGGTITSEGTAIYQPSNTKLTISDGDIYAKNGIGIAVRQGTVNITGGAITANGEGASTVGDAKTELNNGVTVLVDNKTDKYGGKAKVNISGGYFNSSNSKVIESYTGNEGEESADDFNVTGGAFNHRVNPIFMYTNKLEVLVDGLYYVGDDAEEIAEIVSKDGSETITILQGSLTISYAADGFTVKNESDGTVTVNGHPVPKNTEYVVGKGEEITSGEIKTDPESGVTLTGSHITEDSELFAELEDEMTKNGYTDIFDAYELEIKDGSIDPEKGLTLTFEVGKGNNNRKAFIIHKKADGTYETFDEKVENGEIKITVTELSPFMVALGEIVEDPKEPPKTPEKDDSPKTGDGISMALVGAVLAGAAGTYAYRKLHN